MNSFFIFLYPAADFFETGHPIVPVHHNPSVKGKSNLLILSELHMSANNRKEPLQRPEEESSINEKIRYVPLNILDPNSIVYTCTALTEVSGSICVLEGES